MRFMIVMGDQDHYMIWKILKVLNILTRTLYLILSTLIIVKILLVTRLTNILLKEIKSQITIQPILCMMIFQNNKYKGLMLISPRITLGK